VKGNDALPHRALLHGQERLAGDGNRSDRRHRSRQDAGLREGWRSLVEYHAQRHDSGGIGVGGSSSVETTSFGWLLGLGAEYAFNPNWSAFLEYDYMEFDKKSAILNLTALGGLGAGAVTGNVDFKNKLSIAKVGVNYKFGGPVVARY
jgi:opacity protein-like surface antigen